MKLRLRSLQSNQTLKLEVPETCNLLQLIEILSESFSSPPSSSPPRFSLNRKEELRGSSPLDPLRSLGITSGDLIYFSFDSSYFTPLPRVETLGACSSSSSMAPARGHFPTQEGNNHPPVSGHPGNFRDSDAFDSKSRACDVNFGTSSEISCDSGLLVVNNTEGETSNVNFAVDEPRDFVDGNTDEHGPVGEEASGTKKSDEGDCMDIDGASSVNAIGSSERFSEPYFLRWVLRAELGCDTSHHKLLVAAVHAVLLESGFVGYDPVSGSRMEQFHFDQDWPLMWSAFSVSYTLPQLQGKEVIAITLKFETLGNYLNVIGSLATGGANVHRVCLNGNNLAPTLHLLWTNSQKSDLGRPETDGSLEAVDYSHESEVFKFWKDVKDGLCLPLLIDLCDKADLPLPSCFLSLPTDVKLSILKLLPGIDIAKMECVSLEMRYLSSNNELWKQKFTEEFGSEQRGTYPMFNWKQRFVSELEWSKKQKREDEMRPIPWSVPGFRRDPNPLGFPLGGILGGDHDRIPGLGIPLPFPRVGPGLGMPPFTQHIGPAFLQGGRRTSRNFGFQTNCDLGGFRL